RYTKDGLTKRVHSRGIVTRENGEVRFVKGTLRDITKSAELIERLTESEQLNNEAQKLTHLGNWSWDIETGSIQWSDEMYRIYGLEPQSEVITFERFISLVHPDFRQTRIDEINESLKSGIVKDYTLKIVTASGEVKVLRGLGSIAQDKQGKPIKLVGTCQDITEEFRLKSELLDLNKELSEKNVELTRTNKELESFNYIASHDLQEPLRKIELYSEKIICQAESLPADVNITLGKVTSAAARMRNLINDIMAFSQISLSTPVFETLPLNLVFDEGAEFFAEAVEQGQAIFNIGPLADAAIIPSQFRQLLANIFGNAIKYKNPSTAAVINVTGSVVSAEAMSFPGASGNYLRIAISDNGIGFDPDQRDNIFDLFKRLHSNEDYSGTGIGLAICKKIMQNHNGYISADGKPGEGSTFNLYLPYQ
ncbi:MAG: PAS domain S-box protein, partial [Flavobacterium sp.]